MRSRHTSFLFTLALALYALAPHAWATTTGAGLPMESPLDTLKNSLTGPIARDVGLAAIVGAIAMLIWEGQHMSMFVRGCCFLAMGVGALCNAEPLLNGLGIRGATVLAIEPRDELLETLLAFYWPCAVSISVLGILGLIAYTVFASKREGAKARNDSPGRN